MAEQILHQRGDVGGGRRGVHAEHERGGRGGRRALHVPRAQRARPRAALRAPQRIRYRARNHYTHHLIILRRTEVQSCVSMFTSHVFAIRRSSINPRARPRASGRRRQRHYLLPLRWISDQVHRGAF